MLKIFPGMMEFNHIYVVDIISYTIYPGKDFRSILQFILIKYNLHQHHSMKLIKHFLFSPFDNLLMNSNWKLNWKIYLYVGKNEKYFSSRDLFGSIFFSFCSNIGFIGQ